MSDVIDTQERKDSAEKWRTALERAICSAEFGRQVVLSQFTERQIFVCLNGETATITSNELEILNAEVYIPLPMLRTDMAWIYSGILIEDCLENPGIFYKCWHNSPTAEKCAEELRKQLEEDITFWRQMAAEMRGEMRKTDKLIAIA